MTYTLIKNHYNRTVEKGKNKMNKKFFALFTALTLMLLSIAQPALARADRSLLSGTEQMFFGIPGSVWLADGLVQQRDVPLTGTFDFGVMQGTETQLGNAVLDPVTGSGRVWGTVTYSDSDSGVTCSGTRVGRLDQFLVTATVVALCSDGSLLKGTVQDVLIIVPPGSPVPTEVHSHFDGILLAP